MFGSPLVIQVEYLAVLCEKKEMSGLPLQNPEPYNFTKILYTLPMNAFTNCPFIFGICFWGPWGLEGMYLVHGTPVVEHTTGAKFVTSSFLIGLMKHPDNSLTLGFFKGPLT
jgi:hypothetical protein